MIGQLIGNYRVISELGRGAMGQVFAAVNERIGSRVAIKLMHAGASWNAEMAARFRNEARAVNLVRHPGIVGISDDGQLADGSPYLVMELLEGETLRARLQRVGASPPLPLFEQIAVTLSAAHEHRIVHRDLKPDNVMVVPDPTVRGGERAKVLDFGIAKLAWEEPTRRGTLPSRCTRTQTGAMMGTPLYMAPEQCGQAGKVDGQADVYALGVMLYEALAGAPPFTAGDPIRLMYQHLSAPPPPLRTPTTRLPAALAELVHAMLAKEAAARPTMAEVARRLALLQRAAARRQRWLLLPLGATLAGLVGGTLVWLSTGAAPHASRAPAESPSSASPTSTAPARPPEPTPERPPTAVVQPTMAMAAPPAEVPKNTATGPAPRRPPAPVKRGPPPRTSPKKRQGEYHDIPVLPDFPVAAAGKPR